MSNGAGPAPSVLDLRIVHDRVVLTLVFGHLHYPTDIDRTVNEDITDKFLQYRADYNNRPSHSISLVFSVYYNR